MIEKGALLPNHHDVIVIGAGFSGLYAVHKFRDDLGLSVQAFEAAESVGGVWWWNRYPGARCDAPSVFYSYSFSDELARGWQWSEAFASQPEILRYLDYVADTLDIRKSFTFNTRVVSTIWDDDAQLWTVTTDTGESHTARFVASASGNLSVPKGSEEFPGMDSFAGEVHFTSRWPETPVDLAGKRVGVIGTGSTGIQVITEISKTVGHLTVFQRTANFAAPSRNESIAPDRQRWLADNYRQVREGDRATFFGLRIDEPPLPSSHAVSAQERRERYDKMYAKGGINFLGSTFADILTDEAANELISDYLREKIRERVTDPKTADLLCPTDHPLGSKRICMEDSYFEVYNRDNVELVDVRAEPIVRITESGVRTTENAYPLDVIIMATGFDAFTAPLFGLGIEGRNGVKLSEQWQDGPAALAGIAVNGFPNLFTLTGPTTPLALYNNAVAAEDHVGLAAGLIRYVLESGATTIEATAEAAGKWQGIADGLLASSLLPKADSWYLGANVPGKTRATFVWVASGVLFWTLVADIVSHDYGGFAVDGKARAVPPLLKLDSSCARLLDAMLLAGEERKPLRERDIEQYRAEVAALTSMLATPPRDLPGMKVLDEQYPGPGGEQLIRLYIPEREAPLPVLVYYFGGGFVVGSVESMDSTLRALADELGVIVAAPSYRLAPEHPFPAATDDAFAALIWVEDNIDSFGGDATRIVVSGESAGGNLAAVTTLRARDENGPDLAGQVLIMPVIDGEATTGSRVEFADGPILTADAIETMWSYYLGDAADRSSQYLVPSRAASFEGLPPTLVVTAECDPLRDEGEEYGALLRSAGISVTVRRLIGLVHGSFALSGAIPRAREVTEAMAAHLAAITDREPTSNTVRQV
ncbi:flavin-containing monooxygenase [Nocardia sp. JW2]|uniref:flavin-containing monooxygenase n=1 Tax=Nocardia sp. JW2 TaxID=3450738 RepID=UPI003F426C51